METLEVADHSYNFHSYSLRTSVGDPFHFAMGLSIVHTQAWIADLYYCFLLNYNVVFSQSLVILCNVGKSAIIRDDKH